MKITFKLFASLTDFLPSHAKSANLVELDAPDGTTISQLIEQFQLPEKLVHLVLVNGRYIDPALRATHTLQEGDALAIWPPIAGG
jgi:molybdopterin converting factor small subunit